MPAAAVIPAPIAYIKVVAVKKLVVGFSVWVLHLTLSGDVQTWLILPVVICLSQRLSHACLSISFFTAKLRMAH